MALFGALAWGQVLLFPVACFRGVLVMTSGFDNRPGVMGDTYVPGDGDATGVMPPVVGQQPGLGGADPSGAGGSKGRRGLIIVCCILVLVLVCALGAGFWFYRKQQAENAAWQAAHQYQSVLVEVNGESYDAAKSSFVPLRVQGEDLDKKKVDKRVKFFPGKTKLKLMAGRYRLALEASPILDDGQIFAVPKDRVPVQVAVPGKKTADDKQAGSATKADKSGKSGKTTGDGVRSSTSKTVFKLDPISPENVSDEQIAQLRKIYKEYGMDDAQIEQCVKKVTDAREAKKAEIAKAEAEAEAKKAEEAKKQAEQARKAGPFTERQILDATYRHYKAFPEAAGSDAPPVDAHLAGCIPEIKGDICVRVFWDYPDGHTSIARYYGIDSKTGKGYWDHYAAGMGPFTPVDITPYIY